MPNTIRDYKGVVTHEHMPRNTRAKQFMPFAALKGYYDMVSNEERVVALRRELDEERMRMLEARIHQLKRGMMVSVVYYHDDAYVSRKGMITEINLNRRYVCIAKHLIKFDDVWDIEGEGIRDVDEYW